LPKGRLEFAIATNQGSRALTGSYQDVLSQARKIESAAAFMERLERPGSANKEMRTFVQTLRDNLAVAGNQSDEEAAWRVLRHLQIHVYDFDTAGSLHDGYARERAADVLSPSDKGKSGALWDSLVTRAAVLAAVGGATTLEELRADLKEYRFDGDRRYSVTRAAISEAAALALHDTPDRVLGAVLDRIEHLAAIREAAEIGRYVEVRGDAGVGKSGLLRHLAEQIERESRILVLSPKRIPERGWMTMRGVIQFEGTLRELLSDLACDGGGWVFIDNLDGYSEIECLTVIDIVLEASKVAGVVVVSTARSQSGSDDNWLPQEAVARLGAAPPVYINELTDAEVGDRHQDRGICCLSERGTEISPSMVARGPEVPEPISRDAMRMP
jgi:hypothetical protein